MTRRAWDGFRTRSGVVRLELDLLVDQFAPSSRGASSLKLTTVCVALSTAGASALLVSGAWSPAPERLIGGPDRLAVLVGQLDGHDDRVVFEDFAELAELDFFVEAGQVSGHRGAGLSAGRARWRGRTRKISPPSARVVTMTADRRQTYGKSNRPG